MSSHTDDVTLSSAETLTGRVKWFNNKAGYGFITVSDGEQSGKDIFVHFTTVRVTNSQYKYLIQGEYVEFTLVKSTSDNHEYQATDVSGIKGGALMCETRRNNRPAADESSTSPAERRYRVPRDDRPRADTRAPRDAGVRREERPQREEGDEGFTKVGRRKPTGPRKPAAKKDDSN